MISQINTKHNLNKNIMHVAIIILNWQEWEETIQCLNSIIRINYKNYSLVIVDNGSRDDSCAMLENWVSANQVPYNSEHNAFSKHIALIKNPTNLGYAGGNNVGIKFALNELNPGAIWILNNDTTVELNSLNHMLNKLSDGYDVVGSQILFMGNPEIIWCECGGYYSRWSMKGQNISLGQKRINYANSESHECIIEAKLDYIAGASILFASESLRKVGLLCEEYFLYFEELDWFKRAEKYSIRIGYASKSIVYHSVGLSTDKFAQNSDRFYAFKKLQFRNILIFAFKFYTARLPIVLLRLVSSEGVHSIIYFCKKMRMILLRYIPKKINLPLRYYKLKYKSKLDPELTWLLNYFVRGGDTALDVGANIGFYSYGLKSFFKTIHAFEPITALSKFLNDHNSRNVVIHGIACSDSSGSANIYVPKIGNTADYALAGLDANLRSKSFQTIKVQKATIDSFSFEHVDLIKIDVEGHELNVIMGSRQTIVRCRPVILAELENRHRDNAVSTFVDYLSDIGYSGFYLDEGMLVPISNFDPMYNQRLDENSNPVYPYINNFIFIHVSKL
jgi:FkbM family methyltransferase